MRDTLSRNYCLLAQQQNVSHFGRGLCCLVVTVMRWSFLQRQDKQQNNLLLKQESVREVIKHPWADNGSCFISASLMAILWSFREYSHHNWSQLSSLRGQTEHRVRYLVQSLMASHHNRVELSRVAQSRANTRYLKKPKKCTFSQLLAPAAAVYSLAFTYLTMGITISCFWFSVYQKHIKTTIELPAKWLKVKLQHRADDLIFHPWMTHKPHDTSAAKYFKQNKYSNTSLTRFQSNNIPSAI